MENFSELTTEKINPATINIDKCTTLEMVKLINDEDKKVAAAVESVLPEVACAVDAIAESFQRGGRLFRRFGRFGMPADFRSKSRYGSRLNRGRRRRID